MRAADAQQRTTSVADGFGLVGEGKCKTAALVRMMKGGATHLATVIRHLDRPDPPRCDSVRDQVAVAVLLNRVFEPRHRSRGTLMCSDAAHKFC